MPRYLIVRTFDVTEEDMPPVGRKSRQLVEQQFPEITWEHSHVIVNDEGFVRTFCVYTSPSEEMVREHSRALGTHTLDELHEIAGDVTPADFPPIDV
jgi:hypothetical protein